MDTCILCRCGVPRGQNDASGGLHHCKSRSQGGDDSPLNLAMSCQYHHQTFGHAPYVNLWRHAKILLGEARVEDYEGKDTLWDPEPIPLLGECLGDFEYGDAWYDDRLPETLQTAQLVCFGYVDARLSSFCQHLCPCAGECLTEKRARLLSVIRESRSV